MNIFFVGDPHGNFEPVIQAVEEHRPRAVVLLGDMEPACLLHDELAEIKEMTEINWIHGNHECDSVANYDNVFNSNLRCQNLHGRVVKIGNIRVTGFGGIFKKQIWHPKSGIKYSSKQDFLERMGKGNTWRGGLPLGQRDTIWPDDYKTLSKLHADILVTHEAPSSHHYGFDTINNLAKNLGVTKIYHGHQHIDYSSSIGEGIRVYGVGIAGVTDLSGQIIKPGQ